MRNEAGGGAGETNQVTAMILVGGSIDLMCLVSERIARPLLEELASAVLVVKLQLTET
ncbi:MAG: hypothetical protein H8D32_05595 [Dehalococcoidia bacterium]|nr:hypothetical protein [Dehalococcoidia bacterium]